jgi:hypothetical protein
MKLLFVSTRTTLLAATALTAVVGTLAAMVVHDSPAPRHGTMQFADIHWDVLPLTAGGAS